MDVKLTMMMIKIYLTCVWSFFLDGQQASVLATQTNNSIASHLIWVSVAWSASAPWQSFENHLCRTHVTPIYAIIIIIINFYEPAFNNSINDRDKTSLHKQINLTIAESEAQKNTYLTDIILAEFS